MTQHPDPADSVGRADPVDSVDSADEPRPVATTPDAAGTSTSGGDETLRHRPIVSFAPRGGRMNDVQRRAWEAHADTWLVERPDVDSGIDQQALFGRVAPLVLEIGPGMGDATAAMALARPEVNLLAVEVYKPGIAQTFSNLARRAVTNVRVLRADAVEVLRAVIEPGSLAEVWLFFPDPWPKRKHLKRRIVSAQFAELVASRLAPGGSWWMATDWAPYARHMLTVVSGCEALANPHADTGGWAPRPSFRPETRFERRGLAEDRAIFDLHLVRTGAVAPGSMT
jgi:tRNA (guanine-N7-)-methyltransferase